MSADSMEIEYESQGESNELKGAFDQVNNEDVWMYKVDDKRYIGIGKNKDVGAVVGVVANLGDSASLDNGTALLLEKNRQVVKGSEPFVGRWQNDNDTTVEFTAGGTMIGEDADGIWYNFFTVSGDTLRLTGIPDKFVLDGDLLHYQLQDIVLDFYRIS